MNNNPIVLPVRPILVSLFPFDEDFKAHSQMNIIYVTITRARNSANAYSFDVTSCEPFHVLRGAEWGNEKNNSGILYTNNFATRFHDVEIRQGSHNLLLDDLVKRNNGKLELSYLIEQGANAFF